jgi:Transposase DDE domain
MPASPPLGPWIDQVTHAFPKLSRPQATVLALYSFGMILAQRCGLNSVVTMLVPVLGVSFHTLRSRLQEFYQPAAAKSGRQRDQLEVTTGFAPLLAWVLSGWQSTGLALALDATSLGDRFTILTISVVYRGQAIPVAWKVLHANVKHPWKPEWIALLRLFSGWVPQGYTVVVMTDRGLYARWLYQEIVSLGWHPVMRITHLSKFRKDRSPQVVPVTALVPRVGCRWQGRGLAFPKKAQRRLECTLMACWEPGYDEPWFLVTDLAADQAEGLWYGMRSWIEHGFKLLKSGGWQWQATRMTEPDRVERLWLVLAVATCYVLAVGGEADEAQFATATIPEPAVPPTRASLGRPPASAARGPAPRRRRGASERPAPDRVPRLRPSGTKQRLVSVFRQGLAVLLSLLIAGHKLPKPSWKPEPWLELRCEIKGSLQQPPTPIPKNPSL